MRYMQEWSVTVDPAAPDGTLHFVAYERAPLEALASGALTWRVSGALSIVDRRLAISTLTIEAPVGPSVGITSTVLRSIPLGLILQRVSAEATRLALRYQLATPSAAGTPRPDPTDPIGNLARLGELLPAMRQDAEFKTATGARTIADVSLRSKRRRNDDLLRRTVLRLLELQDVGERGIVQKLADEESISYEGMRTRLRVARERGLLGPGRQGSRAAMPGPHLFDAPTDEKEEM